MTELKDLTTQNAAVPQTEETETKPVMEENNSRFEEPVDFTIKKEVKISIISVGGSDYSLIQVNDGEWELHLECVSSILELANLISNILSKRVKYVSDLSIDQLTVSFHTKKPSEKAADSFKTLLFKAGETKAQICYRLAEDVWLYPSIEC